MDGNIFLYNLKNITKKHKSILKEDQTETISKSMLMQKDLSPFRITPEIQ